MYRIGFEANEIVMQDIEFIVPEKLNGQRLLVCHPDVVEKLEKSIDTIKEIKDIHIIHPYKIVVSEFAEAYERRYTGKIHWFNTKRQVPKGLRTICLFLRLAKKEYVYSDIYFEVGNWPSLYTVTSPESPKINKLNDNEMFFLPPSKI